MTDLSSPMRLAVDARRVVVKVGTSVLTTPSHQLDEGRIERLAADLVHLKKEGRQLILVSSGAIGAGIGLLGLSRRPKDLAHSQALAAVGQGRLMHLYAQAFSRHQVQVGQILLTREDLSQRQRYLNARQTMNTLLKEGVVPIVNENDSVAVEEIRFGDNDELSALVSHLMDAEILVLLTDVDGFEERQEGGGGLSFLWWRGSPRSWNVWPAAPAERPPAVGCGPSFRRPRW